MVIATSPPPASPLQPFKIDSFTDPFRKTFLSLFGRPIEHMLAFDQLNERYAAAQTCVETDFLHRALAVLNVSYTIDEEALARIPKTGPLVIISNHPFGGLDGVILAAILRKVRPDTKVMANFLLSRIPELRDTMIFVDPFGGENAVRNNLAAIRQSIEHIQSGNALIIFPAGEVSHLDLKQRAIIDPQWSTTVARIVRKTKAPVLPIYFHGNNSKLFNLLGLVHPLLRTAMLPRELLNKRHARVAVEIGTVVPSKKLVEFPSDEEMTAYLRLRTYILQTRRADQTTEAVNRPLATSTHAPIAPPRDLGLMLAEIHALPAEALLTDNADYAIYAASAEKIPHLLHEIGRQREITFRGANEGTGKPLDLDHFDPDYIHLFCWCKAKQELVGAYRLGQTDVLLAKHGVDGLYTRTLFKFDLKLLEQIGPALELGRSFIRPEYQRSYSPLLLLWKGIGQYIVRNPRYQVMFGPVSINNQYQSFSRQLIMTFLRHTSASHLAGLIRAKNPPRIAPIRNAYIREYSTVVRDIDEVSDLVAEIESDRKGIPILLKQYMKLSARFLGFNIDPDFGDVLDGLVLVDLRRTDRKLLERFTGKEGAEVIYQYQKDHPTA